MPIQRLNLNSTLESIIIGSPDGIEKMFLLKQPLKKEIDYFAHFTNILSNECQNTYVRVKFEWGYGQRPRVLDMVGKIDDKIIIYKKTNRFSIDSNALDLSRIKERIIEMFPNQEVELCLIITEDIKESTIKNTLTSLGLQINYRIII